MALFRTLPTPTNDLPSLMEEVCLVLAPDVNFFLNSRKQGLPCWCDLSFLFFFLFSTVFLNGTIDSAISFRTLWTIFWLAKTSNKPISLTTWLAVNPLTNNQAGD